MLMLSFVQLISRSGSAYLDEVQANQSYVTSTWLGSIQSFLAACNRTVAIPNAWLPKTQQVHDKILMDVFVSFHPGDAILEKLNLVRLYLGVLNFTDITNNTGTEIKPWSLTGIKQARSTLPWPNQERPSEICWVTWKRFLKRHFCVDTRKNQRLNKPLRLTTHLGQWLIAKPYTARNYYFVQSTKNIIKYRNGKFTEYTKAA
eukprot:2748082-Ditylum_brightwellii.AAC.1